jgi:hypothetical protein
VRGWGGGNAGAPSPGPDHSQDATDGEPTFLIPNAVAGEGGNGTLDPPPCPNTAAVPLHVPTLCPPCAYPLPTFIPSTVVCPPVSLLPAEWRDI